MSRKPHILAFAGSTRANSWNQKMLHIASEGARLSGAIVTEIRLSDYSMPIYDADLEAAEGIPKNARKLKALLKENAGLLIASPEYNSGYSPLIKNVIDWTSRQVPGEPQLRSFAGKTAILMSASPGALGGLRGLIQLKQVLGNMDVLVLPQQVTLPQAADAFTKDNEISPKEKHQDVMDLGKTLTKVLIGLQTVV